MNVNRYLVAALLSFWCLWANAQVVINEVMHYPGTAQGLISTGTEYVELFNSSPCQTADISCFIIGCADDDGGIVNNRGSIVIPAGTTIAPYGHYVIGTSVSSANAASVDFKTNLNTANYCSVGNFVMANGDGWVALYNAAGTPVDALYWTVSAGEASKITTDTDLDDNPCVPPAVNGCTVVGSLLSAKQIYTSYPAAISYGGQYVNANTFSRIPDGGSWTRAIAPSINDATVGNCNGGTCLTPATIVFTATKTNPACGNSNGSIVINVTSAGVATYAWSANAATGNNATAGNLGAGTYSVTITQNGCTKDTTLTLNSNSSLTAGLTNPVNPTCAGGDGSVTANLSGGTAPYTVTADTGSGPFTFTLPFAITQTFGNLSAGTVTISVTDAGGCQASATATLTAPANCCTFGINAAVTRPTCSNNNGSITIGITNGSGTFTYGWSANANTANSANAVNLGPGTYSVTVTQGSCTKDTTITISSNSTLVAALTNPVNPTCAGGDGAVTANISGGTAPYTVTADTGSGPFTFTLPFAVSQTFGNLGAGAVTLSVTDAAGCQANANAVLTAPANCCSFVLSVALTQPTCGNSNGGIAGTVSNGSGNYTYNWSPNAATGNAATAGNLAAGQYFLTVTDNGFANCFIDTIFTLTNPNAPVINSATAINETCAGTADGSITLNTSGGTGTLSYTWSANANTGNAAQATGLTAGTYTFTVTDASNCQATGNSIVQSNICCTLQTTANAISTTCGLVNGSITANVATAGTPPYTFALNGGAAQAAGTFNNLAAGNYSVVVTDFNNCTSSVAATVNASTNTLSLSYGSSDVSCFGLADGAVVVSVQNGTPAYTYLWSNGATTDNLQAIGAGSYTVTATDAQGCTITVTTTVNEPAALALNIGNDTTVCIGNTIILDAGAGFAAYNWSDGSTTQNINGQLSGTYTVTVNDANGCTATDALLFTISAGTAFNLGSDVTIYQGQSISLPANINSGNGAYNWSPPDYLSCTNCSVPVAAPTATTTYTLIYTDVFGCLTSDSITVLVLPSAEVYFPTAFSPNGDGVNDVYRAVGSSVKQYQLYIYNRWGELVFESSAIGEGWNGFYKDREQPMEVYTYTAAVTLLTGDKKQYKGTFTLVR